MTPLQRASRRVVLALLSRMRAGQLMLVKPGGRRTVLGSGGPRGTVHVRDHGVWPRLIHGSRGLADSYVDGLFDSPDPTAVIRVAARNASLLDRWRRQVAPVRDSNSARSW